MRKLNIPCGGVLNRAGAGDKKVEEYCHTFTPGGVPLVEGMPEWRRSFLKLLGRIREAAIARSR